MEAQFRSQRKGRHTEESRPKRIFFNLLFACWLLLSFFSAFPARAHDDRPIPLRNVAFEQRLGEQIPLHLQFRDETGKTVQLADYFGKRPVILIPAYYRCQDLCPLVLDGTVRALRAISFDIGNQFNVITVSFDPQDTPKLAAAEKVDFIRRYSRPGAANGWHFLVGTGASIQPLTRTLGFHYSYDSKKERYAHAAGILLLTPKGKIARAYYGIEFSPRDLRLGLIEASANKIGSPIDQLLLFCYHYDPATGKYGLLITKIIRLAGVATALLLGGFICAMLRRERSGKQDMTESA